MMKHSLTILLFATILLANGSDLRAQSPEPPMKVPAATEIDAADLPLKAALDKRYATLLQRFTNWNKEAADYNGTYGGKTFPEGTKEATVGSIQQAKLVTALKSYNKDVGVFNAEVPQLTLRSGCASQLGGTSVVDACNVPSGLHKAVARAIAGAYKDAPSGVSDRIHKGFQAIDTQDWKLARAWFQDALNRDPSNIGIQRLVALCGYTLTLPAPVAGDFEGRVNDFYLNYAPKHPELKLSVTSRPAAVGPPKKAETTIESYVTRFLNLVQLPEKKTGRTKVIVVAKRG